MEKKIILLLGAPGSGKGTQGALLSEKLNLPHISTGDIFRKIILSEDSSESKLLKDYMNQGKLAPSNLVNEIVKKFIFSAECAKGCILDGYPRSIDQAEYFIENITPNINVIFFDVESDIVVKRILGRFSCTSCSKLYNKYFDKPKKNGLCDSCNSTSFITRIDDNNKDVIISRIEEYKKETLPLVEFYKDKGKFFVVNAGEPKEKVMDELYSIIKKI